MSIISAHLNNHLKHLNWICEGNNQLMHEALRHVQLYSFDPDLMQREFFNYVLPRVSPKHKAALLDELREAAKQKREHQKKEEQRKIDNKLSNRAMRFAKYCMIYI